MTEFWRFGHSNDFSSLFGTPSQKVDYALGTIFLGAFVFAIFLAWLALLAIFIFLGPRKVGFLSGFQMKHPFMKDRNCMPPVVRSTFIFSCLAVITITALSVFEFGLKDLNTATQNIEEIVESFNFLATDGDVVSSDMLKSLGDFQKFKSKIINDLRADTFCADKDLDIKSGQPVHELRNVLVQDLYDLEDFGEANFTELRSVGFEQIKMDSDSFNYYVSMFGVKSWHLWLFMIAFFTIPFFMMLGTILAWIQKPSKILACMNTWFHLPLFLVLVTILCSLSSFYSVGTVMNRDFCSGNPDTSASNIIKLTKDDFLLELYKYWVDGDCDRVNFPLSFIPTVILKLGQTKESIRSLLTAMDTAIDIESICGREFIVIRGYLTLLNGDYEELAVNATKIMDGLSCNTVHPLYLDLTHDVVCTQIPEAGILWQLITMSFFGMMMITLRTSWLETIVSDRSRSPISSLDYDVLEKEDSREKEKNSSINEYEVHGNHDHKVIGVNNSDHMGRDNLQLSNGDHEK